MARQNGRDLLLLKDGVAVAHATSVNFFIDRDLPDASTKNSSGNAEHIQGQFSWGGSIDGLIDYSSSYNAANFPALVEAGTQFTAKWELQNISSTNYYEGTVSVNHYEENGDNEAPVSYNATFVGDGALTIGTTS